MISVVVTLLAQSLAQQVGFVPRHRVREWPLTAAYQQCALQRIPFLRSVMRRSEEEAAMRSLLECSAERELERRAVIRDQLPDSQGADPALVERLVQLCAAQESRDEVTGIPACAATNRRLSLADGRVLSAARAHYRELQRIEQEQNAQNR